VLRYRKLSDLSTPVASILAIFKYFIPVGISYS